MSNFHSLNPRAKKIVQHSIKFLIPRNVVNLQSNNAIKQKSSRPNNFGLIFKCLFVDL